MKQAKLVAVAPLVILMAGAGAGAAQDCRPASLYELSFAPVAVEREPVLSSNGPQATSGQDHAGTNGAGDARPGARHSADSARDLRLEAAAGWNRGFYDGASQTFGVDAAATLRDRFRFGAGLGLCSPAAGDDNPLVLSASASAQLFGGDRERFDVVAQLGIARYSMDESTVLLVPVVVGAGLDLSEHVTAYAGPVFHYVRTSRGEGEFFYNTSDKRLGGLAGLQWLAERPVGLNAAITVFRDEIEGYDLCNGEPCTRSVTEWRPVASVRLLYRLGRR